MSTRELQQAVEDFRRHLAAQSSVAAADEGEGEDEGTAGEYRAAEYIIFSLAFDTYVRHLEETIAASLKQKTERLAQIEEQTALASPEEAVSMAEEAKRLRGEIEKLESHKENPVDAIINDGLTLLRRLDRDVEAFRKFIAEHIPSPALMQMLTRALARPARTVMGAGRRALGLRTLLNRGGTKLQRGIFDTPRARQQIKVAISAAMLDNADAALDLFSGMTVSNSYIRTWIDKAVAAAKAMSEGDQVSRLANPVEKASSEAAEQAPKLMAQQAQELGARGAEEVQKAQEARQETMAIIEQTATAAARDALDKNEEPDEPPTRSEVVGLATAAAVAALSDPSNPQSIPETLKKLDDEQRAAALSDGRVAVFAGAGAGKSTTLAARVAHLVRDRKVNPSRILVTSFNTKSSDDLRVKLGPLVGGEALEQMSLGTMHSLFLGFVKEFGTPVERGAMTRGFVEGGNKIAYAVQRIWEDCYGKATLPRMKMVSMSKARWSGNDVSPAMAAEQATTPDEEVAARWYEMYEGLKGTLPGWRPPCQSKGYETFMGKNRPGGDRLGDFTDMLKIYRDILKRSPEIRKKVQGMFDHIIVDECQDRNTLMAEIVDMMSEHITDGADGKSVWMVGDDKQCCHVDTEVATPDGVCRAGDLLPGSLVRAYKNGDVSDQIVDHVRPSNWTWGYRITTTTGKSLVVSPNHRIWVSEINPDMEGYLVYLMYRSDMGFRVGVTSNGRTESTGRRSCVNRMAMENAEAIWFLDNFTDHEEALLSEESYSLQYGVPTTVFNGQWRNLNQDRINAIFGKFGRNGARLLEDRHLDPGLPHWTAYASSNGRRVRRVIQMLAHHSKGTLVSFEWSGDDLDAKLEGFTPVCLAKGDNRRRLRRYFNSYRDGLDFALCLRERTGALLNRRLSLGGAEEPYQLVQASGVFVGMRVAALNGSDVDTEEVTSVEKVEGSFVDLGVKEASNFFGGGILSHNSINSFQGANAELFKDLYEKEGTKTRVIRTNYRCEPEIIEAANQLISHNEGNVPIPQTAAPGRNPGRATIRVEVTDDDVGAALLAVEEIKQNQALGGSLTDHAILCRTNKELNAYETACIIRGVPYARRGASSFFGSPETQAVLGYVQLVTGTDFTKAQEALGHVINNPNRFFLSDPKKAPEAVKQSIADYARTTGADAKSISPVRALKDHSFVRILARALAQLTRTGKGFKFEEKIQTLGMSLEDMQAMSKDPDYSTKNLFDDILSLKGVGIIDGEFRDQTFRESLQDSLNNAIGDEDATGEEADEDELKGLGNVAFLYKLAEKDPTDEDDALTPPTSPLGFAAKMSRYASKMRDLRTDTDKWVKDQRRKAPEDREKAPPGVYVGTVHSTKGSEWKTTFVQMPKGKFPIMFKTKPGAPPPDPEKEEKRIEDERRLGYVALTRAAQNLRIMCPKVVGGKAAGVSPFVDEAGLAPKKTPSTPPPMKEASLEEPLGTEPLAEALKEASNWSPFNDHPWEPFGG
jgi:superfamily I DNA/RNA helicase